MLDALEVLDRLEVLEGLGLLACLAALDPLGLLGLFRLLEGRGRLGAWGFHATLLCHTLPCSSHATLPCLVLRVAERRGALEALDALEG